MDGDDNHLARLSDAVARMSSGLVDSRRSLMVFRSRMQAVEATVEGIGDGLDELDARFLEIKRGALLAAEKSRDTVELCETLLGPGAG